MAGGFFGGAFGAEGDQAGYDLGRCKVVGPAVGIGDGAIEFLVQLVNDVGPGGCGSGLLLATKHSAGGDPLPPIVDFGHGQAGHFGKCLPAGEVEFLGDFGDPRLSTSRHFGERKRVEDLGL